jgi:cytochrome d ubiquinol oxidase subunit I
MWFWPLAQLYMNSADFLQSLLRCQFGLSASFHFLFVPLSIGLIWQVCCLRTAHARRPLERHLLAAAQHWQRYFTLTWAVGIATGYPLRGQLAANWAGYIGEATPVLTTIFAVEGGIAPSMFGLVALLFFFGARLPAWLGALAAWALLGHMLLQALTILAVNAWMQAPTANIELISLLSAPTALHKWAHTICASVVAGSFFVMVLSARHLRRSRQKEAAQASIRFGAIGAIGALCLTLLSGHESASLVSETQPRKFAAFEAHWKAEPGWAPMVLWGIPDVEHGVNRHEVAVPKLMGLLMASNGRTPPGLLDLEAHDRDRFLQSAQVESPHAGISRNAQGLDTRLPWQGSPEERGLRLLRNAVAAQSGDAWFSWSETQRAEAVARAARPNVTVVFWAFRAMVFSGLICFGLAALAFWQRDALSQGRAPGLMRALGWALPLPWVAIISGWAVAEVGRQPWTITGLLTTFHASLHPTLDHGVLDVLVHLAAGALLALVYGSLSVVLWRIGPRVGILGTLQRWWRQPKGGQRQMLSATPPVLRDELDVAPAMGVKHRDAA